MDSHVAEHFKSHTKLYFMVFGVLMVATIVTVSVSYLDFSIPMAILVALVIASIKGSLVALYFMHLSDEKKLIYYVLMLTVVFFVFLMSVPLMTILDKVRLTH